MTVTKKNNIMANVTVSAIALKKIADWTIEDQDMNHDIEIHWGATGRVRAVLAGVDGADWLPYQIDRETWLNEDLPALKEANEVANENYAV